MPDSTVKRRSSTKGMALIVDDDQVMIGVMMDILKEDGYKVSTASDGRGGLDHLAASRFDVVLVDYEMPGMNGGKFLSQLTKIPKETRPIPILVSGKITEEELVVLVEGLNLEDFYVIRKPFTGQDLLRSIRVAILRRKYLRVKGNFLSTRVFRREDN